MNLQSIGACEVTIDTNVVNTFWLLGTMLTQLRADINDAVSLTMARLKHEVFL